jgi:3-dehydroquinate synthase
MKKKIRINAGDGYDFVIGGGLLDEIGRMAASVMDARRIAVFTDSTVNRLYADKIEDQLRQARFKTYRYVYEAGEQSKNLDTTAQFLDFMSECGLTRGDAVAVLGGGVAGDMGGFAASVYLRGIDFMQIPTTLLASVDSSVGGKTGVDTKYGKNLVGTFWQPSLVVCDTDTFDSLGEDLMLDGFAEVIKTAAIKSDKMFGDLENGLFTENMSDIIARCVTIKGDVVHDDEKESGLRRILNFGHTMAHAIELESGYKISHGRAVAIGMLMITRASEAHGLTEAGTYKRLYDLISSHGYQTEPDAPLEKLCEAARRDKKSGGSFIKLVYIPKIGEAAVMKVDFDELYDFYNV